MSASSLLSGILAPLRARAPIVGAVAAVVLLLGLSMAYQSYHTVETRSHTRELSRWEESANFTYGVPVTRNSTIIPQGTVLPMGEPAYFRTVSQFVHVNFTWRAQDHPDLEGLTHGELALRVRAEADDGRSYWEIAHVLDDGLFPDPTIPMRLSGTIDLDAVSDEVALASAELPPQGVVNWTLVATVRYAVEAPDVEEAGTSEYYLPVRIQDVRFHLPAADELEWKSPHVRTGTVVTERSAGWPEVLANIRALLLVLGGVGVLGVTVWAQRTDPARGLDAREAEFQREHARHAEWVTSVTNGIRDADLRQPLVDVEKLDDLVEAAMDARTRVLLDARRRVYYAVLPTLTYRYARHARFVPRERQGRAPGIRQAER